MSIQATYQKAMKFAAEAHAQQKVPGSTANYLLHISNVVMEIIIAHHNEPTFDLEFAIQVGALHDILEDVDDITEDVLLENFPNEVVEAVKTLTKNDRIKDKELKLLDSLDRIASSRFKEASIVKLADRITNLQPPPPHWSAEKCEAYAEQARKILIQLGGANQYLAKRLNELTIQYKERIR